MLQNVQTTEDSAKVATARDTMLKTPATNSRAVPAPALNTNGEGPVPRIAGTLSAARSATRNSIQATT